MKFVILAQIFDRFEKTLEKEQKGLSLFETSLANENFLFVSFENSSFYIAYSEKKKDKMLANVLFQLAVESFAKWQIVFKWQLKH